MIRKLNYIFTKTDKIKICLLLIAVIVGSFLEMLAVSVFSPFINLIMDVDMIDEDSTIFYVYQLYCQGYLYDRRKKCNL